MGFLRDGRWLMAFWMRALWMVTVVGGMLMASCGRSDGEAGVPELFIISPNGTDIRLEFEQRFSQWHLEKYGNLVKIRWPDIGGGGTQNIIKQLEGDYSHGTSCGYDLVFGGGSATFESFRQRNFLVRPPLDDAILAQVPKDVFGAPLHGEGDTWIGAAMSNFGITYNKDRIRELGLQTPRVWEDLAGPQWLGRLSLADPSKSGAIRTCLDQICVQYGWEKGWGVLTLMFANSDMVRDSGSAPADDVGSAQAVAGIVIDFFGRKEILRVGESLVGFAIPEGGSITDCDPIAMLKGAPHPELAAHFIEFVISEEGQKLWVYKAGTPGGPTHYVLGRLSVRPSLYEKDTQYLQDPMNPFAVAKPLQATPRESIVRSVFIGDLIKAALIDNREELIVARRAILKAGDPADLLEKLCAVPHFVPTHVVGDDLVDDAARAVTADQQLALAGEFKPPAAAKTDSESVAHDKRIKNADAGRLQTRLIDRWRREFHERCVNLTAEARRRIR